MEELNLNLKKKTKDEVIMHAKHGIDSATARGDAFGVAYWKKMLKRAQETPVSNY